MNSYPMARPVPTNNGSRFLRFHIIRDMKNPLHFYTGIHSDEPSDSWSPNPRAALIYAHFELATNDAVSLQAGRIPAGAKNSIHQ